MVPAHARPHLGSIALDPLVYRPRNAEASVLHVVIRQHLEDFLRAAANRADGASLPELIAGEFRDLLTCGGAGPRLCAGAQRALRVRAPGALLV